MAKSKPEDSTSNVLARTAKNLAEGLTGLAASEKKDWSLSFGYLLQKIRSGKFLDTLKDEWDKYREKGKIKDDYLDTEQHRECLQEVLDFLDNDSADEIRFNAIKQVFLNASSEKFEGRNSVLPQQVMKTCRSLSSGEVLVLSAVYAIVKTGHKYQNETGSLHEWFSVIAEKSGLKHFALVESYEQTLMKKFLLTPRKYSDGSGVFIEEHDRLTAFGHELCLYMCERLADENQSTKANP